MNLDGNMNAVDHYWRTIGLVGAQHREGKEHF